MDCITAADAIHSQTKMPLATAPAPPRVLLRGILEEHGQTFAVFEAPPSQYVVPVALDDLATFEAFAVQVEAWCGLQVRHPARSWQSSVERAKARGGGLG